METRDPSIDMTANDTLQSELDAFRARFMADAPADVRAAMERADAALQASGLAECARKAGDRVPQDIVLRDVHGQPVTLADYLRLGPVVLSFYRGGWCPYCNLELRALQQALPEFARHGASLVAVSPQTPDASLDTAEKNTLAFPVLSDAGSTLARAFGIAFDLGDELRPIYTRLGHPLPARNGGDDWVLPIPATYVVAGDGTIRYAYVDSDYRNRLEPTAIVEALRAMARPQAA